MIPIQVPITMVHKNVASGCEVYVDSILRTEYEKYLTIIYIIAITMIVK